MTVEITAPEALCVLLALLWQVVVVYLPHPAEVKNPWLKLVLTIAGRISILRQSDAPKTFHLLGSKQPWLVSEQGRRGEMQPLPPPPPRDQAVTKIPLGCLPYLALGSLLLMPSCRSLVDLAELASSYHRAALVVKLQVGDAVSRGAIDLCIVSAKQVKRLAEEAQAARVNDSTETYAKERAAEQAKDRMLGICKDAGVQPGAMPAPDMTKPDPDLGSLPMPPPPPVPWDMASPAPAVIPDAGSRG